MSRGVTHFFDRFQKAFDQSLVVASTPFDQTSASARAPTGLVTPGLVSPTGLPTVEQKPWPLMPSGAMAGLNAQVSM